MSVQDKPIPGSFVSTPDLFTQGEGIVNERKTGKMTGTKAKMMQEFCENTTIHGLPCLMRQSHTSMRIVWTFIVLGGFAGLSLHLYQIIYSYLQYKSTESTYEKRTGFHFPDVTVCNMQGISSSNFQSIFQKNSKFENVYPEILKTLQASTYENRSQPMKKEDFHSKANVFWGLGKEAHKIGHRLQDMIIVCKFNHHECKDDDFILFEYPELFNCYTFKKGRNSNLSMAHGFEEALSLVLYIEPQGDEVNDIYDDPLISNNRGLYQCDF